MSYTLEILFAILITYLFINHKKPKLRYLLYGYLGISISILLQLPFKYTQSIISEQINNALIPVTILTIVTITISEITKYIFLKKVLKTKIFKNGILFGIGWSTIESINIFTITLFSIIFSILGNSFNYSFLLTQNVPFINFIFFFITNIAITSIVIFSVIKKKKIHLFFAILLSITISIGLQHLQGVNKALFSIIILSYCIYLIFNYNKIK